MSPLPTSGSASTPTLLPHYNHTTPPCTLHYTPPYTLHYSPLNSTLHSPTPALFPPVHSLYTHSLDTHFRHHLSATGTLKDTPTHDGAANHLLDMVNYFVPAPCKVAYEQAIKDYGEKFEPLQKKYEVDRQAIVKKASHKGCVFCINSYFLHM